MDLGSLELQIFVSLTVVLGGAFVALVCDFLKGNNEQLREHNIELRVRKEEQERKLLLDPAGFVGQFLPGGNASGRAAIPSISHAGVRAVSAHEVMQSFATPEALMEAETRTVRLHGRGGEDAVDSADVPPLTQRRGGRYGAARKGTDRKGTNDAGSNGESYADWVRPEVIARVARKSEASANGSATRDDLEAAKVYVRPEPKNAGKNRGIRDQVPVRENLSVPRLDKTAIRAVSAFAESVEPLMEIEQEPEAIAVEPRMSSEDASRWQQEIERVALLECSPVAPAPGTILRPLTVPSLRLQEEIERVAEHPSAGARTAAQWHSPLLDEVIAASETRVKAVIEAELIESATVTPAEVELAVATEATGERAAEVAVVETRNAAPEVATIGEEILLFVEETVFPEKEVESVDPPPWHFVIDVPEPQPVYLNAEVEPALEPVTAIAAPVEDEKPSYWPEHLPSVNEAEIEEPALVASLFNYVEFGPQHSQLPGMEISPRADHLSTPPVIEKPTAVLSLLEEPAAASKEFTAFGTSKSDTMSIWKTPPSETLEQPDALILPAPIDISAARQPEPTAVSQVPVVTIPDLLLPTGMHDLSTWTRLLSLPNPMTGILFVITLQSRESPTIADRKGAVPGTDNGPAIKKLMASFVREGDFGTQIGGTEWVFIYNHDVAGFNQRRVGRISEKLWDFQLRHLGMANMNFKWGAVDVESENLGEAWQTARDRMNQTRRTPQMPGTDHAAPRRVVNA